MVLSSESFFVTATSQGRTIRHLYSTPKLGLRGWGILCSDICGTREQNRVYF